MPTDSPRHSHGDQPCDPSEAAAIAQWERDEGPLPRPGVRLLHRMFDGSSYRDLIGEVFLGRNVTTMSGIASISATREEFMDLGVMAAWADAPEAALPSEAETGLLREAVERSRLHLREAADSLYATADDLDRALAPLPAEPSTDPEP